MVGVPGKYKGCNTCRLRRVKCDNERPFCRKCLDSGRECAGYERETVFIIGTLEDQGRCSSHPPRVLKAKKSKTPPKSDEPFDLVPIEPLRPAWDDVISVTHRGKHYRLHFAALRTNLQTITREDASGNGDSTTGLAVSISFPPYQALDVQPVLSEDDFRLTAQWLVNLAAPDQAGSAGTQTAADGICLSLYEHNNSVRFSNQPPWKDPSVQHNAVRRMGPESFRSFPNHHFFVRSYRPNAIWTALLNRLPTFLAGPEWTSTPWEFHPKSHFDHLFDLLSLLPGIFHRADTVFSHPHTMARRLMVQDLLRNCLDIELQLDRWYASLQMQADPSSRNQQQPLLWPSIPSRTVGGISNPADGMYNYPFPSGPGHSPQPAFAFASSPASASATTALSLVYYWTALSLFYPRIWHLYWTVYEPVSDDMYHFSQHHHQHHQSATATTSTGSSIDPMRYSPKRVRELASLICRGLDAALPDPDLDHNLNEECAAAFQPDMLLVPLWVAEKFWTDVADGVVPSITVAPTTATSTTATSTTAATAADVAAGWPSGMGMGMGMNIGMATAAEAEAQMGMGGMTGLGGGMGALGDQQTNGGLRRGGGGGGAGSGRSLDMGMGPGPDPGMGSGGVYADGRLEVMWCEGFRARVARKGRHIQDLVQGRRWVDLATF